MNYRVARRAPRVRDLRVRGSNAPGMAARWARVADLTYTYRH